MRRLRGICCSCLIDTHQPSCSHEEKDQLVEGKEGGMGKETYVRPDAFHANAIVCFGCGGVVRWCVVVLLELR